MFTDYPINAAECLRSEKFAISQKMLDLSWTKVKQSDKFGLTKSQTKLSETFNPTCRYARRRTGIVSAHQPHERSLQSSRREKRNSPSKELPLSSPEKRRQRTDCDASEAESSYRLCDSAAAGVGGIHLGHVAASFKRKLATEQLKPAAETGSQGKKCL